MRTVSLGELNRYSGSTVNPLQYPDEVFELYSVPSYDSQFPEIIKGEDIGSSKVTVEPGDILICKINPRINRVWVVTHNTKYRLLASSEWIVVRSPENNADYLRHYFKSKKFQTMMVSQVTGIGGSLTRAQPKQVATYPVPLPDRATQDQIADILNHIEQIVALRTQQLSSVDEMVKSRFIEMFGDPVRNDKGWPRVPLASLAEIRIGPFGSLLHKEDYVRGGHALVNPSHIIDGKIVTDDDLTVSETKYAEMEAYHLRKGDIVLGRRGEMGRCAVVYNDSLLCGTGSLIIRPSTEMLPYFLQKIISYPTFRESIEDMAVGVTMMNLNVPIVSNFMIPVLPLEEQSAYLRFVEQTDKSKVEIQNALNELEILKKSLMQQYFG